MFNANQLQPMSLSNDSLKNITISLTMACNQGCKHCWVSAGRVLHSELKNEEILDVLTQARELGAEHVKFTGREPLARRNFSKDVNSAVSPGFRVSIETNGTLISERFLGERVRRWRTRSPGAILNSSPMLRRMPRKRLDPIS